MFPKFSRIRGLRPLRRPAATEQPLPTTQLALVATVAFVLFVASAPPAGAEQNPSIGSSLPPEETPIVLAASTKAAPQRAIPQSEVDERIEKLEKELQELRKDTRVLEVKDEERTKAKPIAGYTPKDGFFVQSPDGKAFKLKVGGQTQLDGRFFMNEETGSGTPNQFSLRRVRLDIRGTVFDRFDFRILPDFAGSTLVLQDAYIDTKIFPELVIRAGKFKVPYGLERLQSDAVTPFIELGLPDNLVPNRDVGVQIGGDMDLGVLSYQLAIMNGVPDNGNGDLDVNDDFDFVGRLFAQPFKETPWTPLRGLGIGAAGTYGQEQGTPASPQLATYRTSSRATFFRYSADTPATAAGTTVADGQHYRVSPQVYYYWGPFGALGEWDLSSQELTRGAVKGRTNNDSWQVRATYVLTGEDNTYNGIEPAHNFDFGGGGWGAWEVGARYSTLDVDNDTFKKGFASKTSSASGADSITAAVNWYLNKNIKLNLDYEHNSFNAGAATGKRKEEDVFLTRLQLLF